MIDGVVALRDARDASRFGGKAAQLASALVAGLPVPDGLALDWAVVARVASGDAAAVDALASAWSRVTAPVAVRSSGVGEDSVQSSFAGVHLSVLNVTDAARLVEAVGEVHASGQSEGALAYRAARGEDGAARVAVVVQSMIAPDVSGVLFTRHPVTGADERVIEATWGLGEALVAGLVTPDHVRIRRDGSVIEERLGEKDLLIRANPDGGTEEVPVDPARASAPCLGGDRLALLSELASRCESEFGQRLDIEWCLAGERLYLLQHRPMTA